MLPLVFIVYGQCWQLRDSSDFPIKLLAVTPWPRHCNDAVPCPAHVTWLGTGGRAEGRTAGGRGISPVESSWCRDNCDQADGPGARTQTRHDSTESPEMNIPASSLLLLLGSSPAITGRWSPELWQQQPAPANTGHWRYGRYLDTS